MRCRAGGPHHATTLPSAAHYKICDNPHTGPCRIFCIIIHHKLPHGHPKKNPPPGCNNSLPVQGKGNTPLTARRSGSRQASALPKCSIMSGCGTRIVLRGQKPLAICDQLAAFVHPVRGGISFATAAPPSATGGAHYPVRFWLSKRLSALRIMRYCPSIICAFGLASAAPRSPYRHLELCGIAKE